MAVFFYVFFFLLLLAMGLPNKIKQGIKKLERMLDKKLGYLGVEFLRNLADVFDFNATLLLYLLKTDGVGMF